MRQWYIARPNPEKFNLVLILMLQKTNKNKNIVRELNSLLLQMMKTSDNERQYYTKQTKKEFTAMVVNESASLLFYAYL